MMVSGSARHTERLICVAQSKDAYACATGPRGCLQILLGPSQDVYHVRRPRRITDDVQQWQWQHSY